MTIEKLIDQIQVRFNPHTARQVVSAFRAEPLAWHYLETTTDLDEWLQFASDDPSRWQPAVLALFSLDRSLLEKDLTDLDYLLPAFESKDGYEVDVSAAGTGKAIAAATMGNADVILVHSKTQEEKFIADGYAMKVDGYDTERLTFMYNYFVLVGPVADPAKCAEAGSVKEAFARIAEGKFAFVSRGDQSGTHTKEVSLWPESLGITTDPASVAAYTDWYFSSNAGMGVCLTMANEMDGYVLSDKATFLAFEASGGAVG